MPFFDWTTYSLQLYILVHSTNHTRSNKQISMCVVAQMSAEKRQCQIKVLFRRYITLRLYSIPSETDSLYTGILSIANIHRWFSLYNHERGYRCLCTHSVKNNYTRCPFTYISLLFTFVRFCKLFVKNKIGIKSRTWHWDYLDTVQAQSKLQSKKPSTISLWKW